MSALRIGVIGGRGQVAQSLVDRAALHGMKVRVFKRPEVDLSESCDLASLLADAGIDAVINAAAYTNVDLAESQRELAFQVNVEGAGVIARAAERLGIPVIHFSTDYVFDGTSERAYVETDRTGPINYYGETKLASETAVRRATDNHAIMRTSWVFSAYGKNFVRTMLRLARDRPSISVVDDQIGVPNEAGDIADAALTVAARLSGSPKSWLRGVFHLSNDEVVSWHGFAEAIMTEAAAAGAPTARIHAIGSSQYPSPAPRPANSRLDAAKLLDIHGVRMPSWRDAITPTVSKILATEQMESAA